MLASAAATTIRVSLTVTVRLLCALNKTNDLVYLLGSPLVRAELQLFFLGSTVSFLESNSAEHIEMKATQKGSTVTVWSLVEVSIRLITNI